MSSKLPRIETFVHIVMIVFALAIPALLWIVRLELRAIRWLWRRNNEIWREVTR